MQLGPQLSGYGPRFTGNGAKSASWKGQGIPTASAEALLERMLNTIDDMCAERDRLKKEQPGPMKGRALGGRQW
jgi:hypothetical protein